MIPLQPTDITTGSESRHHGRVLEFLENSSFGPAEGGGKVADLKQISSRIAIV